MGNRSFGIFRHLLLATALICFLWLFSCTSASPVKVSFPFKQFKSYLESRLLSADWSVKAKGKPSSITQKLYELQDYINIIAIYTDTYEEDFSKDTYFRDL